MTAVEPLRHTAKQLEAARRAIDRMKTAGGFAEFEEAWEDFLCRLERAWNKSERAYEAGAYEPFRGQVVKERRSDPLLRYLMMARDANEHTVQETVEHAPGHLAIHGSAGTVEKRTKVSIHDVESGDVIKAVPQRHILVRAESRGCKAEPPTEHGGEHLEKTDPVSVADRGVSYYEEFVRQARRKFGPGDEP
jgi:ribosomal protein L16/L10AE